MRVIVQRSLASSVYVDGTLINKIDKGMVLLVGFTHSDTYMVIDKMVKKIVSLRIFDDELGIMNNPIGKDCEILSISQFTLYASTSKGSRPSYKDALGSVEARKLYDYFNQELNKYVTTKSGVFGADMKLNITNDGPVTICLEMN